MLDPVVIPTLYFLTVLQVIVMAAVVYYAFKVTRLTGTFRAWTLIILAFAILTIRNVVSLGLTLSLPADQLATLIESIGTTATIVTQIANISAVVVLFIGFYGLVKRFESQHKPA